MIIKTLLKISIAVGKKVDLLKAFIDARNIRKRYLGGSITFTDSELIILREMKKGGLI